MKLTKKQWERAKTILKKELKLYKTDPKANFGENEISWNFPHSYPPGSYRLHFIWRSGQLSGYRTRHFMEIPGQDLTFDEEYLRKNFKRFVN